MELKIKKVESNTVLELPIESNSVPNLSIESNFKDIFNDTKKWCDENFKSVEIKPSVKYSLDLPLDLYQRSPVTKILILNDDAIDTTTFLLEKNLNPVLINIELPIVKENLDNIKSPLMLRSNYIKHINNFNIDNKDTIYSPNILLFKENQTEQFKLKQQADFISVISVFQNDLNFETLFLNETIYKQVFKIAYLHRHDSIIIPIINNNIELSIALFKKLSNEFKSFFKFIVFITNSQNFKKNFSN